MRPPSFLLHLITRPDWHAALATGAIPPAPEGFVHLSSESQVVATAGRYYAGVDDLLLLAVPTGTIEPALRWEESRPGEHFPHVYRPITVTEVDAVLAFPPPFDLPAAITGLGSTTGVRRATPDDAEAIAALGDVLDGRRAQVGAPAAARIARYREVLDEDGGLAFVHEQLGRLEAAVVAVPSRADFGRGAIQPDVAHVSSVATEPEAAGRGLASLLLRHLAGGLADDGIVRGELWVFDDNDRARGVYERAGWRPTSAPRGLGADGSSMVQYGCRLG